MTDSVVHTPVHIHLVSDSTGETVNTVARAAFTYFRDVDPVEHSAVLVRTPSQVRGVLKRIRQLPGIVLYTLMDGELRQMFEEECRTMKIRALPILDPVVAMLADVLEREPTSGHPGRQHGLDREYFERIGAMEFMHSHDDGQHADRAHEADVVLVGVSRTSKTPTSMYLAGRGVRVANIPVVPGIDLPSWMDAGAGETLVVALTTTPDRLVQVRRSRVAAIGEAEGTQYTDRRQVRDEVVAANRLYERMGWPTIDVSRRSIEETAALVLELIRKHQEGKIPGGAAR